MNERTTEGGQVVTTGMIAEMAGVTPSAVSNWRRRHRDFPTPVQEAPGGDLFARGEIEAWLQDRPRRGKGEGRSRDTDKRDSPDGTGPWPELPSRMDLRPGLTQGRLLTWLQLLFMRSCLYENSDPTAGAMSTIWQAILADPDAGRDTWRTTILKEKLKLGPDLARALTPASRVPSDDLAAARWIDRLFAQMVEPAHGWLADHLVDIQQTALRAGPARTSRGVAQLVIELLAPLTGTLYDPAFGMGTILALGWNKKEDNQLTILGQEVSVFGWQIAFLRLQLHGADPELRRGDTILDDQFGSLRADRIAIDPPWGVKRGGEPLPPDDRWPFDEAPRNSEWLWVHHMLFHLSDQGRGLVLIPSSLAERGGRDQQERSRFLASRGVDAVIDLPPGVGPHSNVAPTFLLFDRQRGNRGDEVLFIDARKLGTAPRGGTRDLDEQQRARIVSIVQDWRDGSFEPEARLSGSATLEEIEEQEGVWTPSRYIRYVTRFTKIDGEPLGSRLDRLLKETGPGVPGETVEAMADVLGALKNVERRSGRPWEVVRLGELLLLSPRTGSRKDIEGGGQSYPFVATELVGKAGSTIRERPNEFTRGKVGSRLTQPGDLLLTSRGIDERRPARCAIVLVDEALAYSESLMLLRVQKDRLDPRYLGLFLTSQEGHMALAAVTSGTTISNIRPDALANLEIPLPALEVQQQIASAADKAEDVVSQLDAFSERMRDLSKTLHEGLISGVFRTSSGTPLDS